MYLIEMLHYIQYRKTEYLRENSIYSVRFKDKPQENILLIMPSLINTEAVRVVLQSTVWF